MNEPFASAEIFLVLAVLFGLAVLASRASVRVGLPAPLVFLVLGIAAAALGVGGLPKEDVGLAFRLGMAALSLILFDGGLHTPLKGLGRDLPPALVLATVGVVGTAAITAAGARLVGLSWPEALLLGSIVASTDAATVFSVLRGAGINLRRRVARTLELESGFNDPVAVILTFALTAWLAGGAAPGPSLILEAAAQLAIGAGAGILLGIVGALVLARLRLTAGGLYAVFTLAVALAAFGLPTLLGGSGFLAAYVAGLVLGSRPLPYRAGLLRIHDALAWVSQVGMFLALGLLVSPAGLQHVAVPGVAVSLVLGVVARPLMCLVCLLPFGWSWRESLLAGWAGLRGAVPIVLATYPVLAGAPGSDRILLIVFFVVLVNAVMQGGSVRPLTELLGLASVGPPPPEAVLEVSSTSPLDGDILSFRVGAASAVAGSRIADMPFPPGAAVMLVVRKHELLAALGPTELVPGDHVYVFCKAEDRGLIELLFGEEES